MRLILLAIMTFFFLIASAQNRGLRTFRVTQYINGDLYRQRNDTLKSVDEPIDIYFFNRHFYSPYYLPDKFIDQKNRNKKVSVWRDPKGKMNYHQNWENTYTYDSLGRVINYTYSGCFICSNFPYNYTVTYTSFGKVESIFNTISHKDGYKFYYDKKAEVVRFEKYSGDKLETVIELVD